ncbi:amino acid ABC transporter substrate-binding protein [Pseudomonas chlororaphis]|uniref:FecR family protein n=1 Tax=Pseudomonas morbosilactucae TaxID=2938197 RepID=A0ABT0JI45_9PSED|nr:FecR family protein [Pseudomonas morbosilactucae]MCK9815517.1 FecR family protein [Pseudomonas morbosilactucae]ROL65911.1 amino acid ABC transporter substrate-binding protein [Pseudomonas chlororaphis]WEK08301.1 MAG: FecR family protein [Pseudomonas sp.]
MSAHSLPELPDNVLDEAIGWLVRLESDGSKPQVLEACRRWREADALHEAAWQALQKSDANFKGLAALPGTLALDTLERLQSGRHSRRQAIKLLGMGVVISGVAAWSVRDTTRVPWGADYATGVGERRQFVLHDGTRLQLNTASAVDVQFTAQRRMITLRRGEMFIDTGKDSATPGGRRSFWVNSRHAQLQAIGTAFAVRDEQRGTRVRLEDGVVAIHGKGEPILIAAGEEYLIDANGSHRVQASPLNASAWTRGQLVAKRMPLHELTAELERYRHGWLRCDPAIAQLEVSGVFQLDDIDRALSALSDSLPVRVERFTPLWTRVVAR